MGWRERLRPASFKGIAFHIEDHEHEFGRRLSVNEYPKRNEPWTEDLGRRARFYSLNAYIIGENYMTRRDSLIAAIEAGGEGTLVHPYMGSKRVIAEVGRMRESQRDGGMAVITINFVEAGTKTFPNSEPVPSILTAMAADRLIDTARQLFENGITLEGVSQFVTDAYEGALGQTGGIFAQIQQVGGINLQSTIAKINQAADWVANLAEIRFPSISLLADITGTADRIISLFRGVNDLGQDSKSAEKNFELFNDFTVPRTTSVTQEGAFINSNAEVVERFVSTVSLANESKAIVKREFSYFEEAIAARDNLLARLDAVSNSSVDDSEFDALQNLRKNLGDSIPAVSQRLPKLGTVILSQVTPSLVLTYDLYEGLDREADLIARNNIRHPGFIEGGLPLEILKDA